MKSPGSILIMLFLFCTAAAYSQNVKKHVYDDAISFFNSLNDPTDDKAVTAIKILTYYVGRETLTGDEAIALIKGDPFLKVFESEFKSLVGKSLTSTTVTLPSGGGTISTALTATNFADGIAKFLIDRGKQEISTAFFQRMRDEFNKYPELRYLLKNTYAIVEEIESHNIMNLLQELRDAMIKDLSNSPDNILSMRNSSNDDCKGKDAAACQSRLKVIRDGLNLRDANNNINSEGVIRVFTLLIMQGLISGDNIVNVFDRVSTDEKICAENEGLFGGIKLTSILLESLTSSSEQEGFFISQANARDLFSSQRQLTIFLGLLHLRYSRMNCYKDIKLNSKSLQAIFTDILATQDKFLALFKELDKVNTAYKAFRKTQPDLSAYGMLLSGSLTTAANTFKIIGIVVPYDIDEIPSASGKAAAVSTITVAKSNVETRLVANMQIVADFCTDLQKRNYSGLFVDLTKFLKANSIIKDTTLNDNVLKYLSFGTNLASASSSDEVKAAVESIALPPGSYSLKRNSRFNVALNGYIGYAGDWHKKELYAQSVYAPVGLSINFGLGKKGLSAITIFGGIIDVGAVASYRLNVDSADPLKQEVRLESIISPSAQVMIGIPKVPLTVAAGWRKTPKLVFDNATSFQVVEPVDAFNLSLLIDIPIINLFNTPYKN